MDGVTAMLVIVVLLAIAFDYVNGFHDTANAIATSVATRALAPRYAILMAAAFNFIGAFAGTAVASTIAKGLVDETTTTQVVIAAALIGAIAWNLITWQQGLPSSSSHALIGGLVGATIVGAGTGALKIEGIVNKVLIPMVTSPLIGFFIAFATTPPRSRCRRTGCSSGRATSASSARGSTRCSPSVSASPGAWSR